MRRYVLVGVFGVLAACGDGSGSNPFGSIGSIGSLNPFGGSSSPRNVELSSADTRITDGSILVPAATTVTAQAALRGVILQARAEAPTHGFFGAVLVPERRGMPDENGIVDFQFRVFTPEFSQSSGPARTRILTAAAFISDDDLQFIRGFRVKSEGGTVKLGR